MNPITTKISEYLYQFIGDHYDRDRANRYIQKLEDTGTALLAPGCSTIRNGNYFGRNFDFFYSKLIDFVIQIPRNCHRYASIGIGCTFGECTTDNIDKGISKEICNLIPFCVWDGINEKGVTFSTNVVPSIDLDCQTTGTNPGKPLLYSTFIGREILDHAASAWEAIELLKNFNIVTPRISVLGTIEDLHFMIADECETYVVEFINNHLVWKREQFLMTNHYLTIPPQPHSCGMERYDLLKKNYARAGKSMDQMSRVMEQLHYSQAYDVCTNPFWYSEHLFCGSLYGIDLTIFNMHKYEDLIRDFAKEISFEKRGYTGPWHTMHSSIYDIRHRRLRLFIQEDYRLCYEFCLDPAKFGVRHMWKTSCCQK